jgi:hypothetical protein
MTNPFYTAGNTGNDGLPGTEFLTEYTRRQIRLHPEKFGYAGSFAREMLSVATADDLMYGYDQMVVRLMTTILSGRTISEEPEVALKLPATWWQHLKHALFTSALFANAASFRLRSQPKLAVIWLWPVLTACVLLSRWYRKHPVRWTEVTARVHFSQHVLYPEIDAPAQCGRPVIYEEISASFPGAPFGSSLAGDPSRFLNRHEIANQVYRDWDQPHGSWPDGGTLTPETTLRWLEEHGVNVDQLVKRRGLLWSRRSACSCPATTRANGCSTPCARCSVSPGQTGSCGSWRTPATAGLTSSLKMS